MKREIKFRGFSTDTNQWVYGFYRQYPVYKSCGKCLKHINHFIDIMGDKPHSEFVDPDTIGQYTGLKDKHENEVYEGDIISVNGKILKIVEYKEECASFTITNIEDLDTKDWQDPRQQFNECWWNDFKRDIRVVGNIHDTPELLKGGEQ